MKLRFHHALERLIVELLLPLLVEDLERRQLHAPLAVALRQPVLYHKLPKSLTDERERSCFPRLRDARADEGGDWVIG